MLTFTAYVRPEPQGSSKAFVRGGRAHITSDNKKLRPFRSEVTRCAMAELAEMNLPMPLFGKHVPVKVKYVFLFRRPGSIPKRRLHPVVKPDLDKLERATCDSLTGVLFHDDAQVVASACEKRYGDVEGVEVTVWELE